MQRLLTYLFGLLLLAPVFGELVHIKIWRLTFIPSDLIIPVIFFVWLLDKILHDFVWRFGKIGRQVIFFLIVITAVYFINLLRFDLKEMIIAFSGLGRFGMYIVLAPMAIDLLKRDKDHHFRNTVITSMLLSMFLIVTLGFVQMIFFPSFEDLGMDLYGWDPHIGRLLSTWFDPNFVGGYLGFMISMALGLLLYFYKQRKRGFTLLLLVLVLMGVVALYLTFSRSGYLTMMAGLLVLAFFKSRKLLIGGALAFILLFSVSPRMQERTLEMVDSGKSLLGLNSQKPLDPTARLRVQSWEYAWEIIEDNPWLGITYNRYPYEINRRGHGLLSDHSAGGSDSSLLTLWATTGIFGLLSYLSVVFVAAMIAIKKIWGRSDFKSYLAAGLLGGFAGMFVHSLFVHSLLFALMMVYLWLGLALLEEV